MYFQMNNSPQICISMTAQWVASGRKTKLAGIFFSTVILLLWGDPPPPAILLFGVKYNIRFCKITKSGVHFYFSQMGQIFNCY
jgi:hypothetical protein